MHKYVHSCFYVFERRGEDCVYISGHTCTTYNIITSVQTLFITSRFVLRSNLRSSCTTNFFMYFPMPSLTLNITVNN